MKKILQAIDAGGWGGAEKVVVMISNGLAGMGYDVEVWVRRGSLLVEHLSSEVKVRVVPFFNDYEPITPWLFARALKTHDIVNVHLGRAAKLSGYIMPFLSAEFKKRLFCHMHSYHKPKHYKGHKQIICVSKAVEDYVKKAMPWVERTWVVYNGIDIKDAKNVTPLFSKDDHVLRIGLLATFKAQKGHSDLLKAFAKICDCFSVELMLGGDGPLLQEMKNLAGSLGISEKVKFIGHIPPDEVFNFWRSLDVACVPSNVEGFPLSLLEAMACGLPIVGYEEPGIKEAIGDMGILLPVGDIDGLAKALKKVIEDEMLRVKLSDMSLKRSKQFTKENMIKQIIKVYEDALNNKV
ncbi:glycosyltransferase [Acetomicrobium sp. UBA5826]|uniref:glycosyltransferase n=1 Tax=Acetomicrobium sp. UBA5826 TaxID=1946039 RepID=UPI00257D9F0F|nr:glycosyltransferase [Acetomicrobium sp. UBA5826]